MSDKAPERIYVRADCDPDEGWYFAHETPTVMGDDSWAAYVRADLHDAVVRERDELRRKAEHYLKAAQETERELQRILGASEVEVAAAAAMRVVAERDELKAEVGKYFRAMSYWENRGGRAIEERAIAAEAERDELLAKLESMERGR